MYCCKTLADNADEQAAVKNIYIYINIHVYIFVCVSLYAQPLQRIVATMLGTIVRAIEGILSYKRS